MSSIMDLPPDRPVEYESHACADFVGSSVGRCRDEVGQWDHVRLEHHLELVGKRCCSWSRAAGCESRAAGAARRSGEREPRRVTPAASVTSMVRSTGNCRVFGFGPWAAWASSPWRPSWCCRSFFVVSRGSGARARLGVRRREREIDRRLRADVQRAHERIAQRDRVRRRLPELRGIVAAMWLFQPSVTALVLSGSFCRCAE